LTATGPTTNNVANRKLRRRSLRDEVADSLRNMILVGELRPDQRVIQDELAASLGVSTMPVREALLQLSHEGLVEATHNRSFRIAHNTIEDIRDTYWIHAQLAGELAYRASASVNEDPSLVEDLEQLHQAALEAMQTGQVDRMEEANWQFHRRINKATKSPRLLMMLRGTIRLIPQHFYALLEGWATSSETGHLAILEAFRRRDPRAARQAASNHVLEAGELLVTHFSDTGYWTPPRAE